MCTVSKKAEELPTTPRTVARALDSSAELRRLLGEERQKEQTEGPPPHHVVAEGQTTMC